MQKALLVTALAAVGLALAGCGQGPKDYGKKVDKFTGKVVANGKPVSFQANEEPTLQMLSEQHHDTFGVPLQPDGSFTIGWMPTGKYVVHLQRKSAQAKGMPVSRYVVPGGFTIEDGKTDYTVELGAGYKP